MASLSPLLTIMVKAARAGAKTLRRDFAELENLQVRRKGASDFVSEADTRAEAAIVEVLQQGRPKFGLLLEEGGEVTGSDNSNRWIVDPLDGTTNFLHGLDQHAISIGLERDREPYAGVVYAPATDELYVAEKGGGAWCNDRRLRVSGRRDLSECLFGFGLPYMGKPGVGVALEELGRVLQHSAGGRRIGSAALDLCHVAAGRFDGYWERRLQPWDICAGIVILREAGGLVTDLDDSGERPHLSGNLLATNAEIHDAARKLILGT